MTSMTPLDYRQIIADSRKELLDLVERREQTEIRIGQLNKALRGLAPMLPLDEKHELLAELAAFSRRPAGLTKAILNVLAECGPMTANEIRDELDNRGFDMSEYSQPLAALSNTLSRLKDSTPRRVTREFVKGVGLRWKVA